MKSLGSPTEESGINSHTGRGLEIYVGVGEVKKREGEMKRGGKAPRRY